MSAGAVLLPRRAPRRWRWWWRAAAAGLAVAASVLVPAVGGRVARAQDALDRLEEALTLTAFHDQVRARVSGLLDLEAYHFAQPPPGLLEARGHNLFIPRLTLSLDAQLGSPVYFFAQGRLDRGFDPADRRLRVRLDEAALRLSPWTDGRVNLQVGKFATVVGRWVERHLSWDNPLIGAPLPYENVTKVRDESAPASPAAFLRNLTNGRFKYAYLPIIWGPDYTSGAAVSGRVGKIDGVVAASNAGLASRPATWDRLDFGFGRPTVSARLGCRPDQAWDLGFSLSRGTYLDPAAGPTLPRGRGVNDYPESLLGQDVSYAWHHLQLWAECYEARFAVPRVGHADTVAYYLEGRYKFTPQLFGALRWNQQLFGTVPNGRGGRAAWGQDVGRVDAAVGYRFTPHVQLKLQYGFQHPGTGTRGDAHAWATQFTVRF